MGDTIHTVIKTIEKTTDNGMELISKVDSFYNSAWDKLILVGSVAFGVIGILVPFIIQWYQKKSLKISEELLKKDLTLQTSNLKEELLIDINKSLDERIKLFELKIEKHSASSNAKTFHIQGNGMLHDGYFPNALSDFVTAAGDYLYCDDFINLQTILRLIENDCIPKLSIEEITDLKISHSCDLESLLTELTNRDEKGMFSQSIRSIRLKITKLPKLIKDKNTPKA